MSLEQGEPEHCRGRSPGASASQHKACESKLSSSEVVVIANITGELLDCEPKPRRGVRLAVGVYSSATAEGILT